MTAVKTCTVALMFLMLAACGGETTAPQPQVQTAPPAPSKVPDENAALDALTKVNDAQSFHFKRNRRYALALDELVESRDLKSEPSTSDTGYQFNLRPTADAQTYTLTAVPASPSPMARHFFTNQTGVIRAEQGKDADVQSPAITK